MIQINMIKNTNTQGSDKTQYYSKHNILMRIDRNDVLRYLLKRQIFFLSIQQ